MARNVLKTNNTIVLVPIISSDSSFTTSNSQSNIYSFVQASSFSVDLPHRQLKQIGTQNLVGDVLIAQPDVGLEIAYMPEPNLFNEGITFFSKKVGSNPAPSVLSGKLEKATNFYFLSNPNEGEDAQDTFEASGSCATIYLSGWECVAFGNCYLTSYSLNYAVGALPVVSTSMLCSNMKFEQITGRDLQSVAINLQSGNNKQVGNQDFYYEDGVLNPSPLNPGSAGSIASMQNLQVGGQPLGGVHCLQSVALDLNINRVSSYGLGSDYAYNRKAQLPAEGAVTVSSLVSGFDYGTNSLTGFISGVLNNESGYNFDFTLSGTGGWVGYSVEDAKLNSYSYSTAVNDVMTFDANFGFQVTEAAGLRISGYPN
jgi:hypothetical protein